VAGRSVQGKTRWSGRRRGRLGALSVGKGEDARMMHVLAQPATASSPVGYRRLSQACLLRAAGDLGRCSERLVALAWPVFAL